MAEYVSKDEYVMWKNHPSTQKMYEHMKQYVQEMRILLAKQAGQDQLQDRFKAGYLSGIDEAWDLENFIEWSTVNDASQGS